jgi:hypothetical protein
MIQEIEEKSNIHLFLVFNNSEGMSYLIGFAVIRVYKDKQCMEIDPIVFDAAWRRHGIHQFIRSILLQKFKDYRIIITLDRRNLSDCNLYFKLGSTEQAPPSGVYSEQYISLAL